MEDDDFADFMGDMGEFQQNQTVIPSEKVKSVVNHQIDEVAIAKQQNAALAAAEDSPGSSNQNHGQYNIIYESGKSGTCLHMFSRTLWVSFSQLIF